MSHFTVKPVLVATSIRQATMYSAPKMGKYIEMYPY